MTHLGGLPILFDIFAIVLVLAPTLAWLDRWIDRVLERPPAGLLLRGRRASERPSSSGVRLSFNQDRFSMASSSGRDFKLTQKEK